MYNKTSYLFLVFSLSILSACQQSDTVKHQPAPTNIASFGEEDGDNQLKRESWIEDMHRAAPGTDWRAIEYQNQVARSKKRLADQANYRNCGIQSLANNQLIGQWYEIGSTNQAGNVEITAYDPVNDQIWAISGGGTLFQGDRNGLDWQVVNQDYKFSKRFLEVFTTPAGQRIFASLNSKPHYSDDGGMSWIASNWLGSPTLFNSVKNLVVLDDGTIYALTRASANQDYKLYKSIDNGTFFTIVHNFADAFSDHVSICRAKNSNEIYGIERRIDHNKLFRLNLVTDEIVEVSTTNTFTSHYSLVAWIDDNENHFYIYDDNLDVHHSSNYGVTWEIRGQMPEEPWSVGMELSNSNPDMLMFGAVNCFKTLNGGSTWNAVNNWSDYYDDVEGKLHADIMHFGVYKTSADVPFTLVSNHGGISISYDNLVNNFNIGQDGLNVAQYYCVRTLPGTNTIFAGSQDQGFQRGLTNAHEQVPFDQVISGDYGKIVFSQLGQRTWTVYPGGWVTYYHNSVSGGIAQTYELDSPDESTWLPQLMASPNTFENVIYMAGGNINATNGSHMVRLEVTAANQPINVSQSPYDFTSNSQAGVLTALGHSQFNVNRFYAATSLGYFYTSEDQGQTWNASNSNTLTGHYLYGQAIYASPIDPEVVWVAGSGYSSPPVFMSTDGGQSFQPFSDGLPSTMVFDLTGNLDGTLLFAATENGPYVYVVAEEQWFDLSGQCAPTQTYWSVEYLEDDRTARFGTYGRGVWDFALEEESVSSKNILTENSINVYPNPSTGLFYFDHSFEKIDRLGVYNLNGQLIKVLNPASKQVDLSSYPKGIYLLKFSANGFESVEQLVVF